MSQKYSYCVKNGHIIDPSQGIDKIGDIYVHGSKIVPAPQGEAECEHVIDASGMLVLPGLIDFHTHLNRGHSDFGIHPDLHTLPNGITSAVDAGSTGSANFEGFYKDVVSASEITIKSFINISPVGVITERHTEEPNPIYHDLKKLCYMFERYGHHLLGLKLRMGKNFSKEFGIETLKKTREMADRLGTIMNVHVVEPDQNYEEILSYFKKGDILCHCFQGKGQNHLVDAAGKIPGYVRAARERGVIFDGASGRANYAFSVVQKALADGFQPDVISTDVVAETIYDPRVFNLLLTMSAYVAMGMPMNEVIRAVTHTPARLMGLSGQIGTLAPGALADIAVFKIREGAFNIPDMMGTTVKAEKLFVPMATLKAGRIAHYRIDFAF